MYQQIVDLIGDPKHCKHVDSGTRSLVKDLMKKAGASSAAGNELGQIAGKEVRNLCTSITPEGRTVIVLVGAAATIVYGVINYEDLEGDIKAALRRAKVPLKVPLDKVRIPGELKLGASLEEFEAQYRLDAGPGRLRLQLEKEYSGVTAFGARYSQPLGKGNTTVGISYSGGETQYNMGYNQPLLGGNVAGGITYTNDGNTAAFFRFELRF